MREQSRAVDNFAIFTRFFFVIFLIFRDFFAILLAKRPAEGRPEAGPRAASLPRTSQPASGRPKFFRSGLRVYNTYSCKPENTNLGRLLEVLCEFRSNLGRDLNF